MSISVSGADIGHIVETAATVGSILATLIAAFIVYLMVRPSRRPVREAESAEAEELWRIVDLMDRRLEVLERALADQLDRPRRAADREQATFAPAEQGRDSGRKQ
jgi:hypothetical protein